MSAPVEDWHLSFLPLLLFQSVIFPLDAPRMPQNVLPCNDQVQLQMQRHVPAALPLQQRAALRWKEAHRPDSLPVPSAALQRLSRESLVCAPHSSVPQAEFHRLRWFTREIRDDSRLADIDDRMSNLAASVANGQISPARQARISKSIAAHDKLLEARAAAEKNLEHWRIQNMLSWVRRHSGVVWKLRRLCGRGECLKRLQELRDTEPPMLLMKVNQLMLTAPIVEAHVGAWRRSFRKLQSVGGSPGMTVFIRASPQDILDEADGPTREPVTASPSGQPHDKEATPMGPPPTYGNSPEAHGRRE